MLNFTFSTALYSMDPQNRSGRSPGKENKHIFIPVSKSERMIQRIQSVYLTVIILLSLLLLRGNLQNFTDESGTKISLGLTGAITGAGGDVMGRLPIIWPFLALAAVVVLISLITLFLFRKRRIQLRLSGLLIGLCAVLLILFCASIYYAASTFSLSIVFGIKMSLLRKDHDPG